MSSTTESTENELGTVMPKSPNFQLGFAVAVAMSFEPLRVAFTSNVTDFVTPCRVRSPVSMNAKSREGRDLPRREFSDTEAVRFERLALDESVALGLVARDRRHIDADLRAG